MVYTHITNGIVAAYDKVFTWDIKQRQMGMKEHLAAQVVIGSFFE